MTSEADTKTKSSSVTVNAPPKAAPKAKAAETLKVAYTKRVDGEGFVDFVIFGTDADRTEFLRDHPDVWWRIDDLAKGQILTCEKPATGKSDG